MLPNFLVIGAMKAGTDSLYQYLRAHPQVFMSETKELDYFVEELNWRRGRAWYEQQFAAAGGARAIGEASTNYSKYPTYAGVPERIAALLPDVRLIYLVRHPIERMRSQYLHEVLMGRERRPIEVALLVDPTYVAYSRYHLQLSRYLQYFPTDRILVVTSERLRDARRETLARVFTFLDVDAGWWEEAVLGHEHHKTIEKRVAVPWVRRVQGWKGYRVLSARLPQALKHSTRRFLTRGVDPAAAVVPGHVRERLEGVLRDDVARLREFVGPDFDGWGLLATARGKVRS